MTNASQSGLLANPFWVLGVSVRDNRQRIVAAADEWSFVVDPVRSQQVRAQLTAPKPRLSAEMAWLPGLSPTRAADLVRRLPMDLQEICGDRSLPGLARANLIASCLGAQNGDESAERLSGAISEFAALTQSLTPDVIAREINEDRAIAGFPPVGPGDVEAELRERRRQFGDQLRVLLDRTPSKSLVTIVTRVLESGTRRGGSHAPELVDDLVDRYELHAQPFLEAEAKSVDKLTAAAREMAKHGEDVLKPIIDQLEVVVRNWDWVAQPIQLSAKARGFPHRPSQQLAATIRSLGIDLFKQHQMLAVAQRLTALLGEVFAAVPKVADQVEQDVEALDNLAAERAKRDVDRRIWEQEITYRIGLASPPTLIAISPAGVSLRGESMPLEKISRVRWGGVNHSVNGVPTGSTYTIAVGDDSREMIVHLRQQDVYSAFTQRLWKAVAGRLITAMLQELKQGRPLVFNDSAIRDDGLTLRRHQWFGNGDQGAVKWSEVQVWSQAGSFFIGSKTDKKMYLELSYIEVPNTRLLEQAIRLALKQGADKLTDLLDE